MRLDAVAAAITLLIVAWAWLRTWAQKGRAVGKITGLAHPRHVIAESSKRRYHFEVSFCVGEREHSFVSGWYFFNDKLAVGSQVPVAYDPNNPANAEINTPFRRYGGVVLVTVIGAGFLLVLAKHQEKSPAHAPLIHPSVQLRHEEDRQATEIERAERHLDSS